MPTPLKTFPKEIDVKLTEEEIEERRETLAKESHEFLKFKAEAKETRADLSGREKKHMAAMKVLDEAIETGTEKQTVDCFERKCDRTGNFDIIRVDTGEVIDQRAATFEERQEKIPGSDGDQDDEGDSAHH
jgi:hypothetical protein